MSEPHNPVLLDEVLNAFSGMTLRTFVDATLGAGGHASAILAAHPEIETFIGIDQDPIALSISQERLKPWHDKTRIVASNFVDMASELAKMGIDQVDGILIDLGVSSMQLNVAERGFSFMQEGPLDMRMNPQLGMTAADVVNLMSEEEIGYILRNYGEEKRWRAAARAIVVAREKQPIQTTQELVAVLRPIFPWHKKGINPLTLVFQGLRIYVNRELEVLEAVLPQAILLLAPQGRLAVISFHSLEDRIVKNQFRFLASDKEDTSGIGGMFLDKEPTVKMITRKPIVATPEEIEKNPRSRSAKLRVVEKI